MEVSDQPDKVYLVHPQSQPDPKGKLLRSLPQSFLVDEHLVLLDPATGCVHIIKDILNFNFKLNFENTEKKRHLFDRLNVPYERYFGCFDGNMKRCDVIYGEPIDAGSTDYPDRNSSGSLSYIWSLILGGIMVLLFLTGCFCILCSKPMARKSKVTNTVSQSFSGASSFASWAVGAKKQNNRKRIKKKVFGSRKTKTLTTPADNVTNKVLKTSSVPVKKFRHLHRK